MAQLKVGIKNLIILFLLAPSALYSQKYQLSESILNIAEDLAADENNQEVANIFIEQLQELAEKPVRLNSGDEEELSRLFFLTAFQVKALADYVNTSGNISSLYEIAVIPGFDQSTAIIMEPFITFGGERSIKNDTVFIGNTLFTNFIYSRDDNDTSYCGSLLKTLTKYKLKAGAISAGATIEKDAGEKFFSGAPPLPDFLSAHISCTGNGFVKKIIIGDYAARFGQGTNINTGLSTSLTVTASDFIPSKNEIKPYTSTDENNFFRGIATEFSVGRLTSDIFISCNKTDATLDTLSGSSYNYIKSFNTTGLHNTESLLLKKDAVTETSYGVNVTYNYKNLLAGLIYSGSQFSLPVLHESNNPEYLYSFEGENNNIYSVYYNAIIKRIILNGEVSFNKINSYALVQQLSLRPSDRLSINFIYRDYSPRFTTFHGRGPGSGSTTSNEQGLLGNFTCELAKHLFVSAGCDVVHYPWLKYRTSSPSWGSRKEVKIRYLPGNFDVEATYSYRKTMYDDDSLTAVAKQYSFISNTLKASVKYKVNAGLTLTTRLGYRLVKPSSSKGMLLAQDINYHFGLLPLTIWLRYCIFNTTDWDSRLYVYENDLLYSFSIPALSGQGNRMYLMAEWEPFKNVGLRFKYSFTDFSGEKKPDDEIRLQIRVSL